MSTDPDPDGRLTFNLAGLLAEATGARRTFPVQGITLDGTEPAQLAPLAGAIEVLRTGSGFLATGHLTASLAVTCRRCLRPVDAAVTIDLEESVDQSIDLATGAPMPAGPDLETLRLTDHHELVLGPTIRDLLVLAEPIAPLCRPDCPGLCPECGADLALGPHGHPEVDLDPRFAALASLRDDGPSRTG